jgi:glyoxylase-like metal-dependent hydrolase (beta-lactamase superfamily II)
MESEAMPAAIVRISTLALLLAFGAAVEAQAPAAPRAAARAAAPAAPPTIDVWPVRDNIYMLVGAGGNTTVQVGPDGMLVVDTKLAAGAEPLLAALRKISNAPIRYVVNTHHHADHVGGNAVIAAAGSTVAGGNVSGTIGDASKGAAVIAQENVLVRMVAAMPQPPFAAWPTDTFIDGHKDLYFNGEAVQILYRPKAHTDSDSIVFFRKSDVIATGDVFTTTGYPVLLAGDGGSIQGVIDSLNYIIDLTVPAEKQEGGTMVIPGHGRLCDEADVVEYRDMLTIIRDRVRSMIAMRMTLQQVQAAQPTRDYDARYGATTGFWTTAQFVEAVYRTLMEEKNGG